MATGRARVAIYESSGCDELELAAKGGTADAAIVGTAIGLDAPLPKLRGPFLHVVRRWR